MRARRWLANQWRRLWGKSSRNRPLTVHLYALCWNEETMLPYFFRHYDSVADQYFIYDTGSTDGSLDILKAHPRVNLTQVTPSGDSFVHENTALQNRFWKQSRGKADWVIITAIDEHTYHPDLRNYLQQYRDDGITLIRTQGYEMISETFPPKDARLCDVITRGMRSAQWFDKIQAFNPDAIDEINYLPGRHTAEPIGQVNEPHECEVKLLHYKYLSKDYVCERYLQLRTGLRSGDIVQKLGKHYLLNAEEIAARFDEIDSKAAQVV